MCEPTTIITGLSAAAGLLGQNQQRVGVDRANRVQAANARVAQVENANEVTLARGQEADQAAEKINANNMALREAQATTVAAGGPSGLSMDALLAAMGGKGASYNESVTANLDRVNMALDNQLVNVNRGAASTVNGLRAPAPVDYLGAALKVTKTAYDKGVL